MTAADHLADVARSPARGRALVTGATGFMGGHVLRALADEPRVTGTIALVRDATALASRGRLRATAIEGALTSPADWCAQVETADVRWIVHLAGAVHHSRAHPEPMRHTNVDGALAMLELAARLGARLVVASTSGVVGCFSDPNRIAYEDDRPATDLIARWPYYMSKLEAEERTRARAAELGVTVTMLRLPVMLGPGDARFRSTAHVARLMLGKLPFRLAGGIAFVDVRDAAAAAVRSLTLASPRPVYHVPGVTWTLDRFSDAVAACAGCRVPRWRPKGLTCRALARALDGLQRVPGLRHAAAALPDPVLLEMSTRYWGLGSRYAGRELGHVPREPEATIADTVAWLRDHHPALRAD
jgi:dihydroflavonol-4-reductase